MTAQRQPPFNPQQVPPPQQQQPQQPLFASPPTTVGNKFTAAIPSNTETLQFYSTTYGSQQQQGYVSGGIMNTYNNPTQYTAEKTRMFVGSPFGTGGYSDEPPLLEGKHQLIFE